MQKETLGLISVALASLGSITACQGATSANDTLLAMGQAVHSIRPVTNQVKAIRYIDVMFATNRVVKQGAATNAVNEGFLPYFEDTFADIQADMVTWGRATISFPRDRQKGSQDYPSSGRGANSALHFFIRGYVLGVDQASPDELAKKGFQSASGPSLVFVHGFNNSFYDGVTRTAQLSIDLDVKGIPMAFSWPGDHGLFGYKRSEDDASASIPAFAQVVGQLGGVFHSSYNVVAHSMGTRIVMPVLARKTSGVSRDAAPDQDLQPHTDSVILAASDMSRREFDTLIPMVRSQGITVGVYCGIDYAVGISGLGHLDERLGTSCRDHHDVRGVDFVQYVPYSWGANHGYFIEEPNVIDDIQREMMQHQTPDSGGYREIH